MVELGGFIGGRKKNIVAAKLGMRPKIAIGGKIDQYREIGKRSSAACRVERNFLAV